MSENTKRLSTDRLSSRMYAANHAVASSGPRTRKTPEQKARAAPKRRPVCEMAAANSSRRSASIATLVSVSARAHSGANLACLLDSKH